MDILIVAEIRAGMLTVTHEHAKTLAELASILVSLSSHPQRGSRAALSGLCVRGRASSFEERRSEDGPSSGKELRRPLLSLKFPPIKSYQTGPRDWQPMTDAMRRRAEI